jgi:hypothetical protein
MIRVGRLPPCDGCSKYQVTAIAEVFHVEIPTSGPRFDEISRIAARVR